MPITFALIKERKNPPDRRVVFSPEKCRDVINQFPDAKIIVESSDVRIFPDEAYREAGFEVLEDVSGADIMLGVKEVPVDALISNKRYFSLAIPSKSSPITANCCRKSFRRKLNFTTTKPSLMNSDID